MSEVGRLLQVRFVFAEGIEAEIVQGRRHHFGRRVEHGDAAIGEVLDARRA